MGRVPRSQEFSKSESRMGRVDDWLIVEERYRGFPGERLRERRRRLLRRVRTQDHLQIMSIPITPKAMTANTHIKTVCGRVVRRSSGTEDEVAVTGGLGNKTSVIVLVPEAEELEGELREEADVEIEVEEVPEVVLEPVVELANPVFAVVACLLTFDPATSLASASRSMSSAFRSEATPLGMLKVEPIPEVIPPR